GKETKNLEKRPLRGAERTLNPNITFWRASQERGTAERGVHQERGTAGEDDVKNH
ncbi:hypothetical protein P7K49_037634, partial [Saguinus oedipus]